MKIFNWVHRRFNHKYEAGQDVTKGEQTGNRKDKLALLETDALDSMFEGWSEGILAIGTFGFDPALLKDLESEDDVYWCDNSSKELCVGDNVDEDEEGCQEGEMELPLVLKACKHGFFHDQDKDVIIPDVTSKLNDHEDYGVEETDQVKNARRAGERITLADLFWADSEKNLLKNKNLADSEKKNASKADDSNAKHHLNEDRVALISKKKTTKEDAARHIKKINRMVRKMLKKKIHPDFDTQKENPLTKSMRVPRPVKNAW
uniref:Protein TILLER ANGLE CONTROL 1 n=1 Tax=Chrysanthemum morifolium TaxID=41568 RepID=A0A6G6XEL2_CHRMO|nr:Tiller Angle Control 1 [Chrysanthemum x morifolium]